MKEVSNDIGAKPVTPVAGMRGCGAASCAGRSG